MKTNNPTKNQHFISVVEQKLNAIDPKLPRDERAIYVFEVTDPDTPVLALTNSSGVLTEHNLSCLDLFSFNVVHPRYRDNLEEQFRRYEDRVADHTESFLQKLRAGAVQDLQEELLEVFAAKLMNMARNPWSVTKMLNTFGAAAEHTPTDPDLAAIYDLVVAGSRPHAANVCATYGLTNEQYDRWLLMLFGLLAPIDELNILESTIAGMFRNNHVNVEVYEYTDTDPRNVCLLSDRGFILPAKDDAVSVSLGFNINSRAFVIYTFVDPAGLAPPRIPKKLLDRLRAQVSISHKVDDVTALVRFNATTVYQAAHQVFAASSTPRLFA